VVFFQSAQTHNLSHLSPAAIRSSERGLHRCVERITTALRESSFTTRNLETTCHKHHDEAYRPKLTAQQDTFRTKILLYDIIHRLEHTCQRSGTLLEELGAVEGCEDARVSQLRLAGR
jgi:hypothetical protein